MNLGAVKLSSDSSEDGLCQDVSMSNGGFLNPTTANNSAITGLWDLNNAVVEISIVSKHQHSDGVSLRVANFTFSISCLIIGWDLREKVGVFTSFASSSIVSRILQVGNCVASWWQHSSQLELVVNLVRCIWASKLKLLGQQNLTIERSCFPVPHRVESDVTVGRAGCLVLSADSLDSGGVFSGDWIDWCWGWQCDDGFHRNGEKHDQE